MRYEVKPQMVCPSSIMFDLEGDIVKNVVFKGGCDGNLKAISKVIDGMSVDQLEGFFRGNTCGHKSTSCTDQLAKLVREKYEETKK